MRVALQHAAIHERAGVTFVGVADDELPAIRCDCLAYGSPLQPRWESRTASSAQPRQLPANYSNTKELGLQLYTDYAYAFEVAAVILLVAIIAAIALTLRQRKDTRSQDPSLQVKARREERVRLVSMPAERE